MTQPACLPADDPTLVLARVLLVEGDKHSLALDSGTDLIARRAAGCLLAPCPGDRVVVLVGPEPYILSVLERGDVPPEIVLDGNARVRARGGALHLRGDHGVELTTPKTVSIVAETLSIKNASTEIFSRSIHAVAVKARASFDDLGMLAKTYDLIAERISERAERVYRFVSQLDQLRARHLDYRAEHSAQIKGENTVMVARQVAKIDGAQIHVG